MPKFTLELSDTAVIGLQKMITRYNADTGTVLTVLDFLHLHLKELAIQEELQATFQAMRKQADTDAAAAFRTERERLISSL